MPKQPLPVATDAQIQGYLAQLARDFPRMVAQYAPNPQAGLAQQVFNPGNRGQSPRYDVSRLSRGPDGRLTDGTYHYREDGLSDDRPEQVIPGLPGADDMNDWYPGKTVPWLAPIADKIFTGFVPNQASAPTGYVPPQQVAQPSAQQVAMARKRIAQSLQAAKLAPPPAPASVGQAMSRLNPYGTLGPSQQRVTHIGAAPSLSDVTRANLQRIIQQQLGAR